MLDFVEALARKAAVIDARALALVNAVRHHSDSSAVFPPATKEKIIDLY
jgi:ApbE superfamily uncharacterized protein (UPF0280 family)